MIDPERAQRLVGRVVWKMLAAGEDQIGPYTREDFEQELLMYLYDKEAQQQSGNRVRDSDADTLIVTALERRARTWRQWTYDSRQAIDNGFSLDNRDLHESDANDVFEETRERIERDFWLVGDEDDAERRIEEAIRVHEDALRALRSSVPPMSETQKAITRAVRAKPGESNLTDALRRCVAWSAWRLIERGRSADVLLMFRRYRHGAKVTKVEKNRLTRDVLPDMSKQMNRYLAGERPEFMPDGPGSRTVRRRYTPGDGDSPWDTYAGSEDPYSGEFFDD